MEGCFIDPKLNLNITETIRRVFRYKMELTWNKCRRAHGTV